MRWNSIGAVVAVLGWVVACAAAKAPASGPSQTTVTPVASTAPAPNDVHADVADASAGAANAVDAAVPLVVRNAPADDDEGNPRAKVVFDLGAARAGESKLAALINIEAFKANTAGRQLGPVAKMIIEEAHFTHVDDLGINWLLFTSPSLMKKEQGTLTMFCSVSDAKIDKWMDSRRADPSAKPVDVGPGIHAVRIKVDGEDIVLMRPQSHVVVLVAPPLATEAARLAQAAHLPAHADPGEALRFRARNPSRVISELPSSITEARFFIAPRKDQGADFTFEADSSGAAMVTQQIHDFLDQEVDVKARTLLLGLLDHPDFTASGDVARVHIQATDAQLAGVVRLILAEAR
jgi:hypothetical protein